jgi:hypothetical protein
VVWIDEEGKCECDYDEEGNGQKLPFAVVIDSKCLDSVAFKRPKAYLGFLLG